MCASAGGDGSCGFERLEIDGRAYIRYSRYLKINPNDAEANRGAYLAVGFLGGRILTMHEAASCIDLVAQICGHVKGFIGADNRVAPGFELTEYAFQGQRLENLIENGCSPLLQLDVLLQGLNAEGSLGFKPSKPIFLEPAPHAEADETHRPIFYFDSGAAGSQLKLERERGKLKRLTEKLVLAASCADQVQDEWLAYQSMIQQHLPSVATRGTELRMLIDEVERLTGSIDNIEAAPVEVPPVESDRASSSAAHPYLRPVPQGYRSARGQAYRASRRRRSHGPHRRNFGWTFRMAVGGAVVLIAAVTLVVGLFSFGPALGPGGSEGRAPSAAGLPSPAGVTGSEEVTSRGQGVASRAEGFASEGSAMPGEGWVADEAASRVEGAASPGAGAASPAVGAASLVDGAASFVDGAASPVDGAASPAAGPARDAPSAGTRSIDSDREDIRSDVVRERAALGQRTPD